VLLDLALGALSLGEQLLHLFDHVCVRAHGFTHVRAQFNLCVCTV
jgi:hypothetical protein